jgi:type IV pilus assembly protein PilC
MSLFRYEAIDPSGKIVMGAMDASDEAAVMARLSQQGYRPHRVIPTAGASAVSSKNRTRSVPQGSRPAASRLGGATAKDLALFYRQLAALVRSGMSLFQSLDNLAPRTKQPALAQTAREMAEAARSGGRISDVMEKYPRLYSPHAVASVRAGELGGFIEIVLDEIAYDYEQEIAFYKEMGRPKWLVIQECFAIAIAQPLFPHLFPNNQVLEYLKLAFLRNIPITIAALLLVRFLYRWMQEPYNRARRDALALRVPVFGDLARQKSLASFVRMMRRLYQAGIGPISVWEGAMNVAPNAVIRARLNGVYGLMQQGVPIHEAFAQTGLFANETEQLLATGVLSGQVVEMLDRVAEYYQNNVDRAFDLARYWMYRLCYALFIALSGAVLIIMLKSYFTAVFDFTKDWVD